MKNTTMSFLHEFLYALGFGVIVIASALVLAAAMELLGGF